MVSWARQPNIPFDPTAWLALGTGILMVVLYAAFQEGILLLLAVPYGALALYRLFWMKPAKTAIQPTQSNTTSHDAHHDAPYDEYETNPGTETSLTADLHTRMNVTVDGLVRATYAINDVTTQQASNADEQVQLIERANRMLDDFLQLGEHINEQVRSVTQTANEAADNSRSGQSAIGQTLQTMDDIRNQVENIGSTIAKLAHLVRRIDNINTSVGEIATQSNLLALNASIEAARAGIHGRGFAVVADEVRELSKQSTESADQVRVILSEIQQAMKEAVLATQQGVQDVDGGIERTREANSVMIQLVESVHSAREAVKQVGAVFDEQSTDMEQIAIDMDRIARITTQNLASTRTVETVSANLTRLASDLQCTLNQNPEGDIASLQLYPEDASMAVPE
ncbi:hypothetical protein G4Y79_10205 [Phototrophicus methaneseepsis]|uniref:Methyl-accepting transducer domain-containing protein n=1 Tax=Phototrophicus methaneseepsis TaxID=2710758 RepID=A0A7S8ED07_9CHLR|nr:methyl-accepting chemotaxis protein [Phototrophicus methaneseepsis]QPC84725.1 hypothetical protein G4Y79_10205 [Phototrophicus methaneseepsis]